MTHISRGKNFVLPLSCNSLSDFVQIFVRRTMDDIIVWSLVLLRYARSRLESTRTAEIGFGRLRIASTLIRSQS